MREDQDIVGQDRCQEKDEERRGELDFQTVEPAAQHPQQGPQPHGAPDEQRSQPGEQDARPDRAQEERGDSDVDQVPDRKE